MKETTDEIANLLLDYTCGGVALPDNWTEEQRSIAKRFDKDFKDYKVNEDGATLEQVMELEKMALGYAKEIEGAKNGRERQQA